MPINPADWSQLNPSNFVAPGGLASAATIAPTTFLTVLTGNVAVVNITPPVLHGHMLAIQFAGTAGVTGATGNILTTIASVAGQVMLLVFNPTTQKYVPAG